MRHEQLAKCLGDNEIWRARVLREPGQPARKSFCMPNLLARREPRFTAGFDVSGREPPQPASVSAGDLG
jgi:hypothetical protein